MPHHKIVVYVPVDHAGKIRGAIGDAGGGKLGNYAFCSFSTTGTGRFRPEQGANPAVGQIGRLEEVEEERIEVTCDSHLVRDVVAAIVRAHPYEEVVLDVWALEDWK